MKKAKKSGGSTRASPLKSVPGWLAQAWPNRRPGCNAKAMQARHSDMSKQCATTTVSTNTAAYRTVGEIIEATDRPGSGSMGRLFQDETWSKRTVALHTVQQPL